jgi:hypothetical protein
MVFKDIDTGHETLLLREDVLSKSFTAEDAESFFIVKPLKAGSASLPSALYKKTTWL